MANRTVLTPTQLPGNTGIVNLSNTGTNMTATDDTNGMSITPPTTIPAFGDFDHMFLLVLNTNGTGRTITIRAGTSDGGNTKTGAGTPGLPNTPFFEGAKGDLTFSAMTLTTGIGVYGPFEVARFLQPDGSMSIDFSGATGFISAFIMARSF